MSDTKAGAVMNYHHSYDPHTEVCVYCSGLRMDERSGQCHGELKNWRETLLISHKGLSWVRQNVVKS
jgi:hypothetical protein